MKEIGEIMMNKDKENFWSKDDLSNIYIKFKIKKILKSKSIFQSKNIFSSEKKVESIFFFLEKIKKRRIKILEQEKTERIY